MRHCFNPLCLRPQNAGNSRFCQHCGSNLTLGDRFRGLRNLGRGNQTIFAVDEQLPSRPTCVIQSFHGNPQGQPYWSDDRLIQLEAIGQRHILPPLMAVLTQPMRQGSQEQRFQFVVQRHIPGESLAQRLQDQGPLDERAIRWLLVDLLPQLERLHQMDWVHRDLRPETILVAPRPEPHRARASDPAPNPNPVSALSRNGDRPPEIYRLVGYNGLQFNGLPLAEFQDHSQENAWVQRPDGPSLSPQANSPLTHELERLGYRAPEQILGQALPASDLYSLGVTIIQLLTGQRLPHLFDIENDSWTWQRYLGAPLSPALVAIIERLLSRAIRHRYSSAQAVLDDLVQGGKPGAIAATFSPIPGTVSNQASRTLALDLLDRPESIYFDHLLAASQGQLIPVHRQQSDALMQVISQAIQETAANPFQASTTDTTQLDIAEDDNGIAPSVALAYLDLADFYRDLCLDYPDSLEVLAIAICAYRQALTSASVSPSAWSDLGQLYHRLSRQALAEWGPTYPRQCLERAVDRYQDGLDRIQPTQQPRLYIELQRQIGEVHSALCRHGEPLIHWPAAIAAYQLALAHCQPEQQPQTYSLLSNHLGTAYWHLALLDKPIDNLQAAIQHYTAALVHEDCDRDPLRTGLIQNNLGTAYLNLAQQEQSIDLLRLAVGAYQIALIYRTIDLAPEAHRASQNNLGTACLQLACHPYCDPQAQREALIQSIAAYEIALAGSGLGLDSRQSRINFALAHEQLGALHEDDDIVFAHLETALQGYLTCLPDWLPHEATSPILAQAVARIADQLLELNLPIDYPLFQQIPPGIWSPDGPNHGPEPGPDNGPKTAVESPLGLESATHPPAQPEPIAPPILPPLTLSPQKPVLQVS